MKLDNMKLDNTKNYQIRILIVGMIMLILVLLLITLKSGYAISGYSNTASLILNHKIFDLRNNVRNFIILIPNEAHESPTLPNEQRFIDQSYVPENIEVNKGATVMWLNGDVGHEHKINLVDERSNSVFDSGVFAFGNLSKPLVLNNSGEFTYSESNVNTDDPNFIMQGTIDVIENNNTDLYPSTKSDLGTSGNVTDDTIGFLMIPTNNLKTHLSAIENNEVDVLDTYTFEDLRGGQKGTGQQQTLLVLGTSNLTNLMTTMMNITDELPYS
jgi:plastocyanin